LVSSTTRRPESTCTALPGSCLIIDENLPVPFDRRVWMECVALRDAGWSVAVLSPTGKGSEARCEVRDGIRIYRHALPSEKESAAGYVEEYASALLGELRLAVRARRDRPFDVIQVCNPPDVLFLVAGVFKALLGTAVIFDHHDLSPELYEAKFGRRGAFYQVLRLAERLTFATADVVISTNESYRQVALGRGRVRQDRIFVVRNGPDLSRFHLVAEDPSLKRNRQYAVGYVGTMGEQEGIDSLLRSIAIIVRDMGRRDVSFMIIGGGPAVASLRHLAKDMGVDGYVEFTGRVSDDELLTRLSTCDVCVNPDPKTPFATASSMTKIVDYMALEKPIVQYDLKEGRLSASDASLYAPAGDEGAFARLIMELLDDPGRRVAMGAIGRKRVDDGLGWDHQVPALLEAYELALAIRRSRRHL
jgi:glycosyltransferase involved in cell wall biosynthesis